MSFRPFASALDVVVDIRIFIGGIAETQVMLDFHGEHGIGSDIETIPADYINTTYERMLKSDTRYRFVIDISTMP